MIIGATLIINFDLGCGVFIVEFDRDLEEDLMDETSGFFKRFLVSQCNAGREEFEDWEDVDWDEAKADAQTIFDVSVDWNDAHITCVLFILYNCLSSEYTAIKQSHVSDALIIIVGWGRSHGNR